MTDLTQLRAGLREWLIRKNGYFYRPDRSGYTMEKVAAGRYTKAEADAEASIEPENFTVLHESEVPDAPEVVSFKAQLAALQAERDEARARVTALEKGLEDGRYMMSEKHLGSYRLIIGFETLAAVQAAMQAIADFRALLNPSKGSAG